MFGTQYVTQKLFTVMSNPTLEQISQRSRELKDCDSNELFPTPELRREFDLLVFNKASEEEITKAFEKMMGY